MRNLKYFETKSAYRTAAPTFVNPTVSHIVEDGSVEEVSHFRGD